jgi:hypothetical protein
MASMEKPSTAAPIADPILEPARHPKILSFNPFIDTLITPFVLKNVVDPKFKKGWALS